MLDAGQQAGGADAGRGGDPEIKGVAGSAAEDQVVVGVGSSLYSVSVAMQLENGGLGRPDTVVGRQDGRCRQRGQRGRAIVVCVVDWRLIRPASASVPVFTDQRSTSQDPLSGS